MIFMGQKRVNGATLTAFLELEDENNLSYENRVHEAYHILWDHWINNPSSWVKANTTQIQAKNKNVHKTYSKPWDFAVFLLDKKPIGTEVDAKVLKSAFYFKH